MLCNLYKLSLFGANLPNYTFNDKNSHFVEI